MRFGRRVLTAALLGAALTACAPSSDDEGFSVPVVGPAKVDVDTPALRSAKAAAGIVACTPGTGSNDLPAVTLPCLGGGPEVRLDRLEGPLVVAVWAQWCGPCREELPYYQRLSQEYAGKLTVVGIDYSDVRPDWAMQLLSDTGATFAQLADPSGDIAGRRPFPRMNQMPVIALVDAHGDVEVQIKAITSYTQLDRLVQEYAGVSA